MYRRRTAAALLVATLTGGAARAGIAEDDITRAVLAMEPFVVEMEINAQGFPEARFHDGTVLVYVPAGSFRMGSDALTEAERPVHEVHLSGYWIGKYPVTNAQFRAFVDATGYVTDGEKPGAEGCYVYDFEERYFKPTPGRGWRDAFEKIHDDHPVACVSWYDGMAYAAWLSQRLGVPVGLPTEAQWEKAARGADGRIFPWGNEPPDGTRANYCDRRFAESYPGSHQGNPDLTVDDGYAATSPVDAFPDGQSPYGVFDLAGNLTEWVFDLYGPYPDGPVEDPTGPANGTDRCMRCGIWVGDAGLTPESIREKHNLRAENRSRDDPRSSDDHLGIRVVASLDGVATLAAEEKPDLDGVEIVTHPVADGLFMLEATKDVAGNLAVRVSADDGSFLVVDSQFSELAPRIRTALGELGKGPIDTLINTHYHADHAEGNGALTDPTTKVIAHENAERRMSGRPYAARPDETFERERTLRFDDEEIRLLHFPRAHTDGDVVVQFTGRNALHLGDLYNAGTPSFPNIDVGAGGTAFGLVAALNRLIERVPDDARIIPGHYALSDKAELRACRDMVDETVRLVRDRMAAGMDRDEIVRAGVPERYRSWGRTGYTDAASWLENLHEALTDLDETGWQVDRLRRRGASVEPNDLGHPEAKLPDGTTAVLIPAGAFAMGSEHGEEKELPVHRVFLDSYWIGRTPVTVAQFRRFVEATRYVTDSERGEGSWIEGFDLRTDVSWAAPGFEQPDDHPVVNVSWNDANAYCRWLSVQVGVSVRLPTEAQWEKAARGTDGRRYPWGDEPPDGTRANFADVSYARAFPDHRNPSDSIDDGYARTSPVDAYPAGGSPYGVLDLAGNTLEWCHDWFDESYYAASLAVNPLGPDRNPVRERFDIPGGWSSNLQRSIRGGAWTDASGELSLAEGGHSVRADMRESTEQFSSDDHMGFRIVIDHGMRR